MLAGFQVVEPQAGEIGNQHVARQVAVGYAPEIVDRLAEGFVEVLATGFVLDHQHALPEQVDIAAGFIEFSRRLFKRCNFPARDAEYIEKGVPERLGLGPLGSLVRPFAGEREGAVLDFVPAKRHAHTAPALRMSAAMDSAILR